MRETTCETTWFDDEGRKVYVPPNTRRVYFTRILTFPISFCLFRLGFSIIHLQRHEEYWGPDAHIFDPDRWLDFRVKRYTSNPFIFLAFNGGPRIVRPDTEL